MNYYLFQLPVQQLLNILSHDTTAVDTQLVHIPDPDAYPIAASSSANHVDNVQFLGQGRGICLSSNIVNAGTQGTR